MFWNGVRWMLVVLVSGCAATSAPPPALPAVDLNQMFGGWYIIATIPNGFEKGMVQPYDVFSLRDDGDIREDFYVHRGSFESDQSHFVVHDWVRKGTRNAHWRVQVLWPLNFAFLVLYTDPQYRYVIFGEDDRKLGWIYSRSPDISDSDYAVLNERLRALGYDPKQFVRFLQRPDQYDRDGFWIDGVSPPKG